MSAKGASILAPSGDRHTKTDVTATELVNRLSVAFEYTIAKLDRRVKEAKADTTFWRWAHIAAGFLLGYAVWGA